MPSLSDSQQLTRLWSITAVGLEATNLEYDPVTISTILLGTLKLSFHSTIFKTVSVASLGSHKLCPWNPAIIQ